MIPAVRTRANEPPVEDDNDDYELVQEWKTSIPHIAYTDKEKIEGIKDNLEYILRRHPFFMKPPEFANPELYLRPEYGTPSFEWDMVDIIDFTCEIQNKMGIEIADEVMYLDFIQLRDVHNYLYQLRPGDASKKDDKGKQEGSAVAPAERTMLVFPGQGAQKVGMGAGLDKQFPEAKELFDKAKAILGYDLLDICVNGPEEKLNSTLISQPALFVVSMAALARLKKEDPGRVNNCVVTAGLSLGEYTALVFAGVLSFEEGLKLVKVRAEAMQEAANAQSSGMVSVLGTTLTEAKVFELAAVAAKNTNSPCSVSNVLCQGNIVISGSAAACDEVAKLAESFGASKTVRLTVAGAFHSEFMRPAYAKLQEALKKVKFNPPRLPVILNVDAEAEADPEAIKQKLVEQLIKVSQCLMSIAAASDVLCSPCCGSEA
jgi:[acyl-carrier-protein] S-malonyltransferase